MSFGPFDPTDTFGNALSLALCALESGKDGPSQPASVRPNLVALERRGFAIYSEEKGAWRLTKAGKQRAREFLAATRKVQKAGTT